MRGLGFLRVAAAAVCCVATVAGPQASAQDLPAPVSAQLQKTVDFVTANFDVPGAVLGVGIAGQGRFVGVSGTSGLDSVTPVQPDMRFRIGSITKTFVATAVLQLVDECRLGLDDTIQGFQPGLRNADQVTVRELLQHTSGIPDYQGTPQFLSAFEADTFRVWNHQELVDIVATAPPAFAPGTRWGYSNTNYVILGLIVEAVTGRRLEDVLADKVLRPLGLDATSLPTTPAIPPPATSGASVVYHQATMDFVRKPRDFGPSGLWAAGAMVSDLPDLQTWARALAEGTLLSPALQQQRLGLVPTGATFQAFPPFSGPALPVGYGLGIMNASGYVGHNGEVPGYEAIMVYNPRTATTIVEIQNATVSIVGPDTQDDASVPLPEAVLSSVVGVTGQAPQPLSFAPVAPFIPTCPTTTTTTTATTEPTAIAPAAPAQPVAANPAFTG